MNSNTSMDLYRGRLLGKTKEEIIEELERTKWKRNLKTVVKDWRLYLMLIPVFLFFFTFRYLPIISIIYGFKTEGDIITKSTWDIFYRFDFIGFRSLNDLMFGTKASDFWLAVRNTFTLSLYGLIFGFPIPILLALFFSEIKNNTYRSLVQILSYLPRFLSVVILTTLVLQMLNKSTAYTGDGIIYTFLQNFGLVPEGTDVVQTARYFRQVYIISGIWEGSGYGSIVYFAAIMSISPTSYEAARIDGANKWAQIRYVTLPGMAPTLTIMLILRIGTILTIGYEKVLLLTNKGVDMQETALVISTYVYSFVNGTEMDDESAYSFAAAADLFNSLIAMLLVLGANFISRRVSQTSLF